MTKTVWGALPNLQQFSAGARFGGSGPGVRTPLGSRPLPLVEQQHDVFTGMYDEQVPVYPVALELRDKLCKALFLVRYPRRVIAIHDG